MEPVSCWWKSGEADDRSYGRAVQSVTMKHTFKTETVSICQLTQKQNQSGVLTLLLWPCRESVDCLVLPELPDLRDPWESVDPPEPLVPMVAR